MGRAQALICGEPGQRRAKAFVPLGSFPPNVEADARGRPLL